MNYPKNWMFWLDGIVVGEELEMKEYKALRDEMYESRNVTFSAHAFGRKK